MAWPSRLSCAMTSNSRRVSSRPRLLVGSSRTSTRASHGERARDLDDLLRGHGQAGRRGASTGMSLRPSVRARRACRLAHLCPAHEAEPRGLEAQHDVLHHRQVRRERQLLIDHRDAGAARVERVARPVGPAVQRHRRRRPARARRRGSTSACSCPRRSGRRARTLRRRPPRDRLRRPRRVAPNAFRMPRISKRRRAYSQPFRQIGLEQLLHFGLIHDVGCDEVHAGVDAPLDFVARGCARRASSRRDIPCSPDPGRSGPRSGRRAGP